jgi:hypothetical protein
LNDDDDALLESITSKIADFAHEYQFKEAEGEENEWMTYTTDMDEADIENDYDENNPSLIVDNTIAVNINKSFTIYKAD